MRLGQKNLLANPSHMAINSAHGLAFHRGLGTPLYPTSSTTFTKYLDPSEIELFANSAYSKSNIAIVANGASHSELSKWVREFFEDTPTEGETLNSPPSKYHGGEERIAHDKGNVMVIAFPGSSSFTSGASYKPEIAILAALLGGESSIKWTPGFSLLSKAASQYQHAHVSTQNYGYSDAGLLAVTLTGKASHVGKAGQSVVEALKKIASGEVSSEDIKKATALTKFQALETGQDINAGLEATGSGLISGGKAYQIDEIAQAIEKVGEDKVKAVSQFAESELFLGQTLTAPGCQIIARYQSYGVNSGRPLCPTLCGGHRSEDMTKEESSPCCRTCIYISRIKPTSAFISLRHLVWTRATAIQRASQDTSTWSSSACSEIIVLQRQV
jgi:ubiquinol-cytochrome c reductase core subunit 2